MHWSKPLRLHLGVLVVASLLCTSTPIIWLAFRQGSDAAVSAGVQQMREMSLRLIEGYRNTLQGGTEAVALASTLPQLTSPPPQDIEAKQQFFLEVLRNVPNATSVYTGYPDGSYLQVINTQRQDVRRILAAPDGTAFAIRTIARRQGPDVISTFRFLDRQARPIAERDVDHGPLWDLAEDKNSIALIQSLYQAGKPVAFVCHAPGVLRHVKAADGGPLVLGRQVTGFKNSEEDGVGLTQVVPFLVEDMDDTASTRRGPNRSVNAPTTGDIRPFTTAIGATTAATTVRSHPVSSVIGTMKTLKP